MAATGAVVMFAASCAAAQAAQPTLAGTWNVTRSGVDCVTGQVRGSFPAMMVFHDGGTYSGFPANATGADQSPEFGTWQRAPGAQNYTFRITGFGYDAGAFAGTFEIDGDARVSQQGAKLDYTATISFFDVNGNRLFSFCGQASGVRFQ